MMRTLKGIAANLAFIFGSVLVLLPIGILSWLLERAAKGLDVVGYAVSDRLPEPRQVFSDGFGYWFWQVLAVGFFLLCMLYTFVFAATGKPWDMIWHLVQAMVWAIIITRAWEKRHAN